MVLSQDTISDYLNLYNDFQKQRHNVRPGMTGLARKAEIDLNGMKDLNLMYGMSTIKIYFWLKNNFFNFLKIFDTENIQHKDEITMYKFTGNDEGLNEKDLFITTSSQKTRKIHLGCLEI